MARFTDKQLHIIRTSDLGNDLLAERFGVSPSAISKARNGHTYKSQERKPMGRFSDAEVRAIRQSKEKAGRLGYRYGVSRITIWHIRNRITYAHVPDEPQDGQLDFYPQDLPGAPHYPAVELRYGIEKKKEEK